MAQTSGKLHAVREVSKVDKVDEVDEHGDALIAIDNERPVAGWQGRLVKVGRYFSVHYWMGGILVGAVALGFNFYRLGTQSMWFDEILSVERARQSLPDLIKIITSTQPNMALYYILMHYWLGFTTLLGWNPTEIVARAPSAILAAASSVMVFLLGRRFLGMAAGLVAGGLYVLNDLQLTYAQDTRSYALQLLLICFAWYALFTLVTTETRQKRWWIYFGVAMVLAVYSQLFSFLILVAQMATFVGLLLIAGPWRVKARQQFRNAAITLFGIFVLTLPMIYASRHGSKTGWLPIPHPVDIYLLFLTICANSKIYLVLLLAVIVLGLAAVIMVDFGAGRRLLAQVALIGGVDDKRGEQLRQWFPVALGLVSWIIVSIVLSYGISQTPIRLFSTRYLVTIVPPFVLLVGLGVAVVGIGGQKKSVRADKSVSRGRADKSAVGTINRPLREEDASIRANAFAPLWRLIQIATGVILLLLTLHYVPLYYQQPQIEDWNVTTFWLEQHYQANDGLVCFDNSQGCQVGIEYYLTAYPSAAHFTADSPGSFPWAQYDLTNHQPNTGLAVDPHALATFGAQHPRIFFITGRLSNSTVVAKANAAQRWLDAHFHFVAQIVTKSVTVRLYGTK